IIHRLLESFRILRAVVFPRPIARTSQQAADQGSLPPQPFGHAQAVRITLAICLAWALDHCSSPPVQKKVVLLTATASSAVPPPTDQTSGHRARARLPARAIRRPDLHPYRRGVAAPQAEEQDAPGPATRSPSA